MFPGGDMPSHLATIPRSMGYLLLLQDLVSLRGRAGCGERFKLGARRLASSTVGDCHLIRAFRALNLTTRPASHSPFRNLFTSWLQFWRDSSLQPQALTYSEYSCWPHAPADHRGSGHAQVSLFLGTPRRRALFHGRTMPCYLWGPLLCCTVVWL